MKLLLTGHRGFIGQNLLSRLLLTHQVDTYDLLDALTVAPTQIDLSSYDWVIHLGAHSSTTETDIEKVLNNNLTWSVQLFEQCVKHNVNFQWASSASVYGKRDKSAGAFRETDRLYPANLYAMSKYLLEQYILAKDPTNIIYQGFRYFNVYGPHEDHKKTQASPYYQFAQQAIQTGCIKIFDNSENCLRDFVSVEKLCDVHEIMVNNNTSGIWNVGTGKTKSFLQVAQEVAKTHGAEIELIPFPDELKQHYQYYTCADITNISKYC